MNVSRLIEELQTLIKTDPSNAHKEVTLNQYDTLDNCAESQCYKIDEREDRIILA
jgi:hypothetical protein